MKNNKATLLFAIAFTIFLFLIGCETKTDANTENQDNRQQTEETNVTKSMDQTDKTPDILIKAIELANLGKVEGSDPIAIGSKRKEVEKAWGKPTPGKEDSEEYKQKNIAIYYDESNQVDQLITTSPSITSITRDEVLKAFGRPQDTKTDEGITHFFYNTENDKYDLTITLINNKISEITVGNKSKRDPDQ